MTGAVTLTPEQSRRLWNWVLHRQGLHPDRRLATVEQISRAGLGLHAARLPSPYATVLARTDDPRTALSLLSHQDGLTTLRCMRKTLHLLPLDLAASAHSATAHYRIRDASRLAHNANVSAATLAQVGRDLLGLLSVGPLHHREIERALSDRQRPAVRVALKIAWERGDLTYANRSGCWNREHRTFGLTRALHPSLDIATPAAEGTRALVQAYFDRYGPATIKDATWWSALSRTAIIGAMAAVDTAWLEVRTPWAPSPAYMPAHRFEEFEQADPGMYATGLNLLAHEDVALKAYFETRDRYLDGLPAQQAFNQIGEALPTIVVDGVVHGTWAWSAASRTVTATLASGRSRGLARRVRNDSERLTEALRAGWRERIAAP